MKLTTFLLLATVFQLSAKTHAQTVTFSGKNVSLLKVFEAIERQTGYAFFYKEQDMQGLRPVTVLFNEKPLNEALDQLLEKQQLEFELQGRTIFIRRTAPEARLLTLYATVNGTIKGPDGLPLAGATVRVKGKNVSTITDKQGQFSLSANEGEVLVISYVGFATRELTVKGTTPLEIVLQRDTREEEGVEVRYSTGYYDIPKERATGSFGVVTSKQLEKFPVVSVLERLQGLVPGVDISTKTTAGKSRNGTVKIRGLSTIVSSYTKVNTDPLLVIDGFPSQISISAGALDFLNPDDIQSITFLKDAAAASIWGMQAANGVIVIETKKGSRNSKATLSFSTTQGLSSRPSLDYGKRMSVAEYIDLEKELVDKGRLADPLPASNATGKLVPENISQAQEIVYQYKRGTITEQQMNDKLAALGQIDNRSQMEDYLLQSPTTQQYNLSLSGGGLNSTYFLSGYFYKDQRVYRNNTNRGYSLRAGNTSSLLDNRITVTTDLTFANTRDKINSAAVKAMSVVSGGMRPYDLLKDENGNNIHYDLLMIPQLARSYEALGYLPMSYSPIDELDYNNTTNTSHNLTLNMSVNGRITPWLSANISGNVGRIFSESEIYMEPESYDARMLVNRGTSISTTGARIYGVPNGGKLDLSNSQARSYNLRGQLNVNKSWADKHQLNILLGTEIREVYSKGGGEIRYGYDKTINTFRTVNPTAQYRDMFGGTQTIGATSKLLTEKTTRSLSHYANGSYTFQEKYTLSGSVRFDDYNLLGVERRKRAIPLWSGGVKWEAGKEAFLSGISWLDRLALRATLGFSGNAPQGFAPVTVINLLGSEFYSNQPYAVINNPAMSDLGWEKTRMINFGIDFSLFRNRVFGSVEYYLKHTTDIIWQMPINGSYGWSNLLFNTANLEGHGVDIGLSVVAIASRSVNLTSTFNLSYNTNIIKDSRFENKTTSFSPEMLYSGYPTDYLFSYLWAGLDNTGQSLIRDPDGSGKVYTVSEYPYENIRAYSGRSNSPWVGSWTNTLRYKGLELGVQFQYAFGGVFRKPSIENVGFSNNIFVGRSGDMAERWRKPGDEAFTNVPGMVFTAGTNYYASSERYGQSDFLIRSRSNIRLQQVSVSYELPARLLSKIYTKTMTVGAVARNLGMIWAANKEKLDPDYLYTTGNNYQLPPLTNYSLRLMLTL
ncbi:MAG: SusC/RagA family TonB-linked outer membrane protein [Candidatus Pseudobacter hemicellulosilyticus]|uniref:SusC/RagA family TonB-linked outer membrane protein n=1 Tax=Candidatus Pseudobacter hemicellulosilyticus TaxID=3121375 RepID=A0AAJ5X1I2_9BACT|nr:MAG: SusC/RagA family TonB-linked outer membrane protein [Pseudobacter sp.]